MSTNNCLLHQGMWPPIPELNMLCPQNRQRILIRCTINLRWLLALGWAKRRTERISTPIRLSFPLLSISLSWLLRVKLGQQCLEIQGSDMPSNFQADSAAGRWWYRRLPWPCPCTNSTEKQSWMKLQGKPYVHTPPCDEFANYSLTRSNINTESSHMLSTMGPQTSASNCDSFPLHWAEEGND